MIGAQTQEDGMNCNGREPSLGEILADPITAAVMQADGVDRPQLEALLHDIAGRLRDAAGSTPTAIRRSPV
jgi:hypothetical protein